MRTMTDFPRNEAGLVDEFLGTAYDTVKAVYDNLEKFQALYDVLEEIDDLAQQEVAEAMAPFIVQMEALLADGQLAANMSEAYAIESAASAALAALSAAEAVASADRANAINVTYPFTFHSNQATYNVNTISGDPTVNTTSLALWVEGALEFDFTVNSLSTFTLNTPSAYPDGAQMRIIINGKFDGVTAGLDQLMEVFQAEFDASQAAREEEFNELVTSQELLENALAAATGSSKVGFIQVGVGAVPRTVEQKLYDQITPEDYGALPGVDATLAFAALEAQTLNVEIDLHGKTYVVENFPVGNQYYNGKFQRIADSLIVETANKGVNRSGNANCFIGRLVATGLTDYSYTDPLGTTRGYNLVAIGPSAMQMAGPNAWNCTAVGRGAMFSNQFGHYNIAIGLEALYYTDGVLGNNFLGTRNVVVGDNGMRFNTTGYNNIGLGRNVNQIGTTAVGNVFIGAACGAGWAPVDISGVIVNPYPRTVGLQTAIGLSALDYSSGIGNTAVGANSGSNIKRGEANVSVGYFTLGRLEIDVSPDGYELVVAPLNGSWVQEGTAITVTQPAHGMSVGFRVKSTLTGATKTPDAQIWTITSVPDANSWTAVAPDSASRSGTCNRIEYHTNTLVAVSSGNTAIGNNCMGLARKGNNNTAIGSSAMVNIGGNNNVAVGTLSLNAALVSVNCVAVGYSALRFSTGSDNVAVGDFSAGAVVVGNSITALGRSALRTMVDGSSATAMQNVIGIGTDSRVSGDNQAQIGNSSMTTYVFGTVQNRSDLRDKAEVRNTALGLDFIMSLRPVDYKWDMRDDYIEWVKDPATGEDRVVVGVPDGSKMRNRFHHGFIAQEVEATGADFGGFQDHKVGGGSDIMTLGYDEFIAPLVRAVQELKQEIVVLKQELGHTLA